MAKTNIDLMFSALTGRKFVEAQGYLTGAKEDLKKIKWLAFEDENCKNAVDRLSNIIHLVEQGQFEEARNEQVLCNGVFRSYLRSHLLPPKKDGKKNKNNEPLSTSVFYVDFQKGDTVEANPNRQQDEQHEKPRSEEQHKSKNETTVKEKSNKTTSAENNTASQKAHTALHKSFENNCSKKADVCEEIHVNQAKEVDEQTMRSKYASQAVQRNNPDIADLSDVNRPTKLAERFSELYDNEWTEAFDFLHNQRNVPESEAIKFLLRIVDEAYKFCTDKAKQQIEDLTTAFVGVITHGKDWLHAKDHIKRKELTKEDWCVLVQIRKENAAKGIPELQKKFADYMQRKIVPQKQLPCGEPSVDCYCKKAVELTWWMCVQDPAVYMCSASDSSQVDRNLYRAYTKSGEFVHFYVWPALRLYKDGGVLAKGVVQYK